VGRGGRRHCRQVVAVVNGRIARWAAGQYGALVREYLSLALEQRSRARVEVGGDVGLIPPPVRRAALRAVRDGALSKAARILSQQTFPLPEDVQSALEALHPAASEPFSPPVDITVGDDFTVEEVAEALRGFAPGTAGGYSGLMPQHLRCERLTATYLRLLQQIARLCSDFAWGRLSPDCLTALAGARLIALGKSGRAVRPIAVGETLRRLAGKLLIARYQPEAASRLQPEQVGVGVLRGAESLVHKIRMWLQQAAPNHVLLQLDFKNAFNSAKRRALLQAIADHCPWFLPYALACYARPGSLFADGGFTVLSAEGVHQGDPCGPLFFALCILALTKNLACVPGCWSQWYLDDGYLVGPRDTLHDVLPQLEAEAAKLGLQLNRNKCSVLVPADGLSLPDDFLPGVPRVSGSSCLAVLGSPVGGTDCCRDWADSHVGKPLALALDRLMSLGEPRAASLVLRQCFSACKVNWILRTAESSVGRALAETTAPLIRQAWDGIVGAVCSDLSWELASLCQSAWGAPGSLLT
jgi:hypothetical protein